ncbi:MAG: HlyD family efflux transporter periplasmic adaptor subunit [Flavobacteriia bacterium]|nr:HlyD family efflux transporter periplasmic adaptor subunit [Flavobacteriia bacterium]
MKTERKVALSILGGIIILAASFGIKSLLASQAEGPAQRGSRPARGVIVSSAKLDTLPYQIQVYGQAKAYNRVELFAEVTGVLQPTQIPYLEGESFRKGQTLLRIEDSEARASLMSQRSNYINTLTQVLPDIKLDYPEIYPEWESYLLSIDVNASTPAPPTISNPQARILLTARGVISAYHALQSAEERLSKHNISAPFDGVVTQSSIRPGTLVRVGQPLGTFIDPTSFEVEVTIIPEYLRLVNIGDRVELQAEGMDGTIIAYVKRVNAQIDPSTQSMKLYLGINASESELTIQEGMYLKGHLNAVDMYDVVPLPRRLVNTRPYEGGSETHYIWRVNKADSTAYSMNVSVVGSYGDMLLIEGIEADGWYISEVAPGLLEDTKVNVTLQ